MFAHILLVSDGSACALQAAALASKYATRLTILSVDEAIPTVGPYGEMVNAGLEAQYILVLQEHAVSDAVGAVNKMGVSYQSRQEIGQPATEIVCVAQEERCDLIVLGSRGLSGFKSFLLGSVSDHVTHHAHCPVLIVK